MTLTWESHHAIHAIMVRIHTGLNQAKWEDLAEIFHEAQLVTRYSWSDTPLVAEGGQRIAGGYRDTFRLHDGLPRVQYTLTNELIEGDDAAGVATAWSQYFAIAGNERTWSGPRGVDEESGSEAARLQVFIAGRYEDEFRRDEGGWRLRRRTCHADFTGDRSAHLRVDPYALRELTANTDSSATSDR
jgi:hypothetical protein